MDKKQLAIKLSKLKLIDNPNVNLEQYQTEGELAADILWKALANKDIENKIVSDFGCGNGIFGIGALLLGAKKAYFLDIDKESIKIAKENYKNLNLKNGFFINKDILEFNKNIDVVLMNPPFGVQKEHIDKTFLEKAFQVSKTIYSLHKIESKKFILAISKKYNFSVKEVYEYNLLIKQTYSFHKSKNYLVKIGCWYLVSSAS